MSASLFIGLHINACQISASFVRRHPSLNQSERTHLTIERDTYLTRSYEISPSIDPREIISIWIDCLDDLLEELFRNFQDDFSLNGVAISTPGPMFNDEGIFLNHDDIWRTFFGLNFRLIFQNALRELIQRWKNKYPSDYQRTKKISRKKLNEKPRRLTIIPPTSTQGELTLTIVPAAIREIAEGEFSRKSLKDFCGQHDDEEEFINKERANSRISESAREHYFHDVEHFHRENSSTNALISERFWSMIEELPTLPISFHDESTCFGRGEMIIEDQRDSSRILSLTIGTTFNSTFLDQNEIIRNRPDVPINGQLAQCPYDQHFTAEQFFSIETLKDADETFASFNSRVARADPTVLKRFQSYARRLALFLIPYVKEFRTDLILIGGDLTQYWFLIENEFIITLREFSSAQIYFSLSYAKSICLGAVEQHLKNEHFRKIFRQTDQYLLPVTKTIDTSIYDIYPSHSIPIGQIEVGHRKLNEKLVEFIEKNHLLLIDGFVGTFFSEYADELNRFYFEKHRQTNSNSTKSSSMLLFYDSQAFLRTDNDFQREIYLKDPRSIFGQVASNLDFRKDFLDENKIDYLQRNLSSPAVVIGPGAAAIDEKSPLIYIDLAKNELYYRIASHTSSSYLKPRREVSSPNNDDENSLSNDLYEYKCLYFLDYPVLNRFKQELIPRWNYFIDGQRPNCPTWIDGETFRQALTYLSRQPIRLRPWFESSLWGGQYIKRLFPHLCQHSKNYGWSYEMVPSENGLILIDEKNRLLEVSWDIFYGTQSKEILGNDQHVRLFHQFDEFPLRINFLDTIDGGNLALQTNPSLQYIRTHYGEKFAQDQTFYIVQTKQSLEEDLTSNPHSFSCIYLGFHSNINVDEFHEAIRTSFTKRQDFNIVNFVQCLPTHDHDFFLIPHETIHALGRNQFAIEISSSPRIYSLKLYDWLRTNFDGRPRHLSIDDGLKNLNYDRHIDQLRSQPIRLPSNSKHYEEHHLPTHSLHFYDVHRLIIEPDRTIELTRQTENRFQLCVLIEGDAIEIRFSDRNEDFRRYNTFETFLLPASINEYSIRPVIKSNETEKKPNNFILLFAFLKTNCEKYFQ